MSGGRALSFLLLGYLLLVLLAVLTSLLPVSLRGALPELALLVVLYLGLSGVNAGPATERSGAVAYVAVGLLMGYLADLLSGAPRGLHAFSLALVMVLSRSAHSRLMVTRAWQEMLVALLAAAGHGALVVALSSPGGDDEGLSQMAQLPLTSLTTAVAAPILFALFRRVDRRRLLVPGALKMS